jgi:hypothetical protein
MHAGANCNRKPHRKGTDMHRALFCPIAILCTAKVAAKAALHNEITSAEQ